MARRRRRRKGSPPAPASRPSCPHPRSDWTWVPERARWEGRCQTCSWTHVAAPEMAASLERDVAAYCDSHPLVRV